MNDCGLSDGSSFESGLTGGPKFTELGVSVDVEEHEVDDDFCDCKIAEELMSSMLSATVTGDSQGDFGDTFISGDEVDLGENRRVKRDLSEGALEVGVVVVIA